MTNLWSVASGQKIKVIFLCGPTAVGKSKFAYKLLQHFPMEIVSCDSGQVWKGLDIGTAKPSAEVRAQIPHHAIDIVSPSQPFDVADYLTVAHEAIAQISSRGEVPLVVGGAGMYLRLLTKGLCDAPPRDPKIREEIYSQVQTQGLDVLYQELKKVDPNSALKIHPHDKIRIVRALEVHTISSIPLSQFHLRNGSPVNPVLKIGLNLPREELYARIDRRVEEMMEKGWLEEVRQLLRRCPPTCQALSHIGYRDLVGHLSGKLSLEETISKIKKETRNFAKRQMTWFRADSETQWFHPSELEGIESRIKKELSNKGAA